MPSPQPSNADETTVKQRMVRIIEAQPEDSSFEETLRELAFARMIRRGLEDVDQGRTVSHEEVRREVDSWAKGGGVRRLYDGSVRSATPSRRTIQEPLNGRQPASWTASKL